MISPKLPKLLPSRWTALYRGHLIDVETYYQSQPRWSWQTTGRIDLDGRARTRLAAVAAAKRTLDSKLGPRRRKS